MHTEKNYSNSLTKITSLKKKIYEAFYSGKEIVEEKSEKMPSLGVKKAGIL